MGLEDADRAFDDEPMEFAATDPAAEGLAQPVQKIEDPLFLILQGAPFAAEKADGAALAGQLPSQQAGQQNENDEQTGRHKGPRREGREVRARGGAASRSGLRALFRLLQEFEDVLESHGVLGADGREIFVRLEDGFAGRGGGGDGIRGGGRRGGGLLLEAQDAVEAEVAQDFAVARVRADDAEGAFRPDFHAHADEGAHEGGIHEFAVGQIDDELTVAAADHFLGKIFQAAAVLEGAAAGDPEPDGVTGQTGLD